MLIEEAKQFIFDLDGSCGYDYGWDRLSFQKIDYPPWDMYFCHECSYKFPLVDYLCEKFDLRTELDCVQVHAEHEANMGDVVALS